MTEGESFMRRYLVCSDIHGFLENFIEALEREQDVDDRDHDHPQAQPDQF